MTIIDDFSIFLAMWILLNLYLWYLIIRFVIKLAARFLRFYKTLKIYEKEKESNIERL